MLITNTRVYGLEESIVASGYPMLIKPYTERQFKQTVIDMLTEQGAYKHENKNIFEENKHFKRFMKLSKAKVGSGHNCALKGVIVQMDVKAPQYFWQQLQRYHFIDIISSMSKVHCLSKMDINTSTNDMVTETAKSNLNGAIQDNIEGKADFDTMMSNVPMGLELTARLTTNYLQLRTIYEQRKNHKSVQWRGFCEWIKTLPYAKELITNEQ